MGRFVQKAFPYAALLLAGASLAYVLSFGRLPLADLTFNNGAEVSTIDPSKAEGVPEGRIVYSLFEGLLTSEPVAEPILDERGRPQLAEYDARPGVAESYRVSPDGKTYTFVLRKEARWSDGSPITAEDFFWSWRRTLHPDTASKYTYQMYYIVGAKAYNTSEVEVHDQVEVELDDRIDSIQPFPRGTVLRGILTAIEKPKEPEIPTDATEEVRGEKLDNWRQEWVYTVDVKREISGVVQWQAAGEQRQFSGRAKASVERALHVLPEFESTVGVTVKGEHELEVRLINPTSYFKHLVAFYTYFPVQRACVEKYGSPNFTRPENLVCNGAFKLQFRRIRDRIRMVKNENYWNREHVRLNVVDALAVNENLASLTMYENGQLDWIESVPNFVIPELKKRNDFHPAPMLSVYFYRLNVTRKPLDDVRVRRALNLATDKQKITEFVAKAGQIVATNFVPPGMPGYVSPSGEEFNVALARQLLAEAGFPGGKGFPKIDLLYNTQQGHKDIAEVVERQWREHLGINIELRNMEWKSFLDAMNHQEYTVTRSGWTGDYPDPNTFLDMFVTGGDQNLTGWSNRDFDKLIADAAREGDAQKRFKLLHEAESILNREVPIIPFYYTVSQNMVRPYVKGFAPNLQDLSPLHRISIDAKARDEMFPNRGSR